MQHYSCPLHVADLSVEQPQVISLIPKDKNVRTFHGCEEWIEKSVPRVFVRHHEAVPSDAEQWSRGTDFSIHTENSWLILFLAYHSIVKIAFTLMSEYAAIRHNVLTSLCRCKYDDDTQLNNQVCDILYNVCTNNTWHFPFFILSMGEIIWVR